MSRIVVAVGSVRKPKLAAVREAIDEIGGLLAATLPGVAVKPALRESVELEVIGVEVESGVTHTPTSREELMRGARQRAEALQARPRQDGTLWDYFVGLEGGLDSIEENGVRRVFLESWAYASDGTRGFFGGSGAVELPEALAEEVLTRGTELSAAIDQFAQQTGIRDAQGAWGVLTADQITRREAFRIAVIAAFAPFYNEGIYGRKGNSERRAAS